MLFAFDSFGQLYASLGGQCACVIGSYGSRTPFPNRVCMSSYCYSAAKVVAMASWKNINVMTEVAEDYGINYLALGAA